MSCRQVAENILVASAITPAGEASAADGHLGLIQLVGLAKTDGGLVLVKPACDSTELIGFQQRELVSEDPHRGYRQSRKGNNCNYIFPGRAGDKDHGEQNTGEHQGGAQVWLENDQPHGDHGKQAGHQEPLEPALILAVSKVPGKAKDQPELHQLAGLHVE